ncbi:MAG: C69 family dipeptidase [Bacteroidales bacterium]|nr:C69 family dipeptidase [Bacteroidales bacterium]
MKTVPNFLLLAALAASLSVTVPADACTNLIVGKAASADGSVMCTYNCDGFGFASPLSYYAPGRHLPGEMIALRGWGPDTQVHQIAQAGYTYGVVGLMNENQVSIVETTWDGRKELYNPEGYLDYFTLMHLALQRSTTAREAIAVMDQLVQEYGYNATGESFAVCDKDEAWIMELIGKGPGRKGAVWVALRVPDDCITAYANSSRIRQFPQARKADKILGFCVVEGECMYSADVISFAREMGFYSGNDADFSFREAYGPLDFSAIRYCEARVWSFFRHHYDTAEIDSYLPFINGQTEVIDHLPLWIKPDKPVSVRDLMNDMRDHYEGTALDMTADLSAGPWASPYRNQPVNFKSSDGTDMFRERPIGCQQSGMTMVCQMRSWLPDAVGGVTYFNMDDASMVAYVPVYCGIDRIPDPFRRENNNIREFSTESAFWMNNFVANMVYPRYSAMIGDLREAQTELEDYYAADQKEVEEKAVAMTAGERTEYLTGKTLDYTDRMMKRWDKLARLLIVKHNDQIMQPSENGVVVAGRRSSPAYAPAFVDAVKAQTGDRYVHPEKKQ